MVDSSFYDIKIPNARLDQQILNPPSASDQMVLFNFQHGVTFQDFKSLGKLIIKIVYNPTLQQRSKREVWKALFYICLLKMAINLKKRHFL